MRLLKQPSFSPLFSFPLLDNSKTNGFFILYFFWEKDNGARRDAEIHGRRRGSTRNLTRKKYEIYLAFQERLTSINSKLKMFYFHLPIAI